MNRDNDFDNDRDYPITAAAAAAAATAAVYAVHSLEEDDDESSNKTKSNPKQQSSKDGDIEEVPTISTSTSKKMPDPYIGSPSTSADKHYLNTNEISKSPETPLPDDRSLVTTDQPIDETTSRQLSELKPAGAGDSMADAWEKEEMESIKKRCERLKTTIDEGEIKKKKKADLKLEKIKANNIPDKKRAKAVQRHDNEIKRIQKIAKGDRVKADAKYRKKKFKVKEKADKIRSSTGKLPATCLCF